MSLVEAGDQKHLATVLENYRSLQVVYQFRLKLQNIWAKSAATQHELLGALQEWCRQAESTGIGALRDFVSHLKMYVPKAQKA